MSGVVVDIRLHVDGLAEIIGQLEEEFVRDHGLLSVREGIEGRRVAHAAGRRCAELVAEQGFECVR